MTDVKVALPAVDSDGDSDHAGMVTPGGGRRLVARADESTARPSFRQRLEFRRRI
jgi:hypothetical protein